MIGCGSDPETRPPSESEQVALTSIVGQVQDYKKLIDAQDASQLLAAVNFDPYESLMSPLRRRAFRGRTLSKPLPDCTTTTPSSVTFTDCEIDGHRISGEVSKEGDLVTVDLEDNFELPSGITGTATLTGKITVTRTSIDGDLHVDASWTDNGTEGRVQVTVSFDGVTTDSNFCPVGGTLTVSGSVTRGFTVTAKRKVTFGPSCGEATVE